MTQQTTAFDYIIVGAGSAGCVLADRLSADGQSSVLLIEAGADHKSPLLVMPRGFLKLWGNPRYFWNFPVEPEAGRPEKETWVYGKGLGGSSSVNGTWYLRGMPSDYDSWGESEWRWSEIERCYQALESYRYPHRDPSRGTKGPLQITESLYRSPVIRAIVKAGQELGLPLLKDINQPGTDGIGFTQATVDRRGRRASSYRAFVKGARKRRNLTVVTDTQVKRVVLDGLVAKGVAVDAGAGAERIFTARQEVILSAGVLQSPKLLQLSGIGPAEVLRAANVPVAIDLPAVGRNLSEHAMFSISFRLKNDHGVNREFSGWRLNRHVLEYYLRRSGLMAFTSVEVTALFAMNSPKHWPDVQIGIAPFSMWSSEEHKADPGRGMLEDRPGITLNGFYLRPKGKGTVSIRTADVNDPPVVHANWWHEAEDRDAAVAMLRLMRQFAAQPALAGFVGEETVPGAAVQSDEDIARSLIRMLSPGLHGTGTCRMGRGGDSVVDARLRVHGIRNLRIVDCSIMPAPVSGNTNGPAMVVAARAAELILEDRSIGGFA